MRSMDEYIMDEKQEKMFFKALDMSQEERYGLIDTGLFNPMIEGYVVLVLEEIGADKELIDKARDKIMDVLQYHSAEEAMNRKLNG